MQVQIADVSASPAPTAAPKPKRVVAEPRYYRIADVCSILRISRQTYNRRINRGLIPKPRRIAGTHLGWPKAEFDRWLTARDAEAVKAIRAPRRRASR